MTARRGGWLDVAGLILVNLLWAAQYPAYAIAGAAMEPGALNFWTLLAALLLLLPWWIREWARRAHEWPRLLTRGHFKDHLQIAGLVLHRSDRQPV